MMHTYSKTIMNSATIKSVTSIKYLGIVLSSNFSWSAHVLFIFGKIRRLSFYISRLRYLSVPIKSLLQFIYTCVLTHWLYCSPVVFPRLLSKDFVLIRRTIKCISKCSGYPSSDFTDFIVNKHLSSCERFSHAILSDHSHPLHYALRECLSTSKTRNMYKPIYARTSAYRNSCIPYLARFLISKEQTKTELLKRLS